MLHPPRVSPRVQAKSSVHTGGSVMWQLQCVTLDESIITVQTQHVSEEQTTVTNPLSKIRTGRLFDTTCHPQLRPEHGNPPNTRFVSLIPAQAKTLFPCTGTFWGSNSKLKCSFDFTLSVCLLNSPKVSIRLWLICIFQCQNLSLFQVDVYELLLFYLIHL